MSDFGRSLRRGVNAASNWAFYRQLSIPSTSRRLAFSFRGTTLAVLETARARISTAGLDHTTASALFGELYWALPDVGAQMLAGFFGHNYRSASGDLKVPPVGTGVHCVGCGSELMAGSRTALVKIQSGERQALRRGRDIPPRCDDCRKSHLDAFSLEWRERRKREAERQRDLRSMPYSLYLKTPEWQATRGAALKRARYACQLCKRNDATLDVHHNTYERRGSELASDLLVVCRSCHEKHHDISTLQETAS